MKKVFAIMLLLVTLLLFAVPVVADAAKSDDIVILYTNDVHCGIEENIGYAGLVSYKENMLENTPYVTMVDWVMQYRETL